jgi:uncharacterized protein YkwD
LDALADSAAQVAWWLRQAVLDDPKGDEQTDSAERVAVDFLTSATCSRFRLASSVRKEWCIGSLLRVVHAARQRLGGALRALYLPPLSRPVEESNIQDALNQQGAVLRQQDGPLVAFVHGSEQYARGELGAIVEALASFQVLHLVFVERQYVGHAELQAQIECLVAKHRLSAGAPPLAPNAGIARCALLHAMDMSNRGLMSHCSADGATPTLRLERLGLRCASVAENLSLGSLDAEEIVALWMQSATHRASMLGAYQFVGVGFAAARRGDGAFVNPACTALFASCDRAGYASLALGTGQC